MEKQTLPNRPDPQRCYVDDKRIGEIFGLSTRTIQRYAAQGIIPKYRVGPRVIRFRPDEVERALLGDQA